MRPPRPAVGPARGVLPSAEVAEQARPVIHTRHAPAWSLAEYVAHFWWVQWDVATPQLAETLPHPTVHFLVESPAFEPTCSGLSLKRFSRTLVGAGNVFGIKLRPAVFSALCRGPLGRFRDHPLPLASALPAGPLLDALMALGRAVRAANSGEAATRIAEALLPTASLPELSPPLTETRDLVERIEHDRSLIRVDDLAKLMRLDTRSLERRFQKLVGLTPKAVLARYRLIEAAEQLQRQPEKSLAQLASELGYVDQAHFSRDFRKFTGRSPGALRTHAGALRDPG